MIAQKPYLAFCPQCGRAKLVSRTDCLTPKDFPICPSCKVPMREGIGSFLSGILNKFSSKKK